VLTFTFWAKAEVAAAVASIAAARPIKNLGRMDGLSKKA